MINMFSNESILFSIPDSLDKKLIFCLDGIRVSLQNIDLSFFRVLNSLNNISNNDLNDKRNDFSYAKLDAWACVDNIYRFIGLWKILMTLIELNQLHCEKDFEKYFDEIIKIRNVQSHLAQRIDFIVSNNASVNGELSWVKLETTDPLLVKTYFIRSGLFVNKLDFKFNLPKDKISFSEFGIGSIIFNVSGYYIDLIKIYDLIFNLKIDLEIKLVKIFSVYENYNSCPANVFGSAILDTNSWICKL